MKQYVIDELRVQDYEQIKAYLDGKFGASELGGLYWVPLKEDWLNPIQAAHKKCQPICFAIDLQPGVLTCELLLRTRSRIRCDCICYADENQRNRIMRFIDDFLEELGIKV